jgi:hypothetical protein
MSFAVKTQVHGGGKAEETSLGWRYPGGRHDRFNGKAWLDNAGNPITDAHHVIERLRRRDFGHLDLQLTIDDPKA